MFRNNSPVKSVILWSVGLIACVTILSAFFIEINFSRTKNGFFVLKGERGKFLRITSDLYLGEEDLLITGFSLHNDEKPENCKAQAQHLALEWDADVGTGHISNHLADGTVLVTNFSRYRDSLGHDTRGLFIGGASPSTLLAPDAAHMNDSGMTWYNGQQWNHIWCNTNEGIGSTVSPQRYAPSDWKYLGSRVLEQSPQRIVISSSHEVLIDSVPLQIERVVEAVAGQAYLNLELKITNNGLVDGHYFYYYGDEPWLGDFGGSAGDVGWVSNEMVEYESVIDTKNVSYAGMADFGSDTLNEGHAFRHVANFVEWFGPNLPDVVFFANKYDGFAHAPQIKVPLQGNARSIGMYWGPRLLHPGESHNMALAIGKAETNMKAAVPAKPCVDPPHQLVARARQWCGPG